MRGGRTAEGTVGVAQALGEVADDHKKFLVIKDSGCKDFLDMRLLSARLVQVHARHGSRRFATTHPRSARFSLMICRWPLWAH